MHDYQSDESFKNKPTKAGLKNRMLPRKPNLGENDDEIHTDGIIMNI